MDDLSGGGVLSAGTRLEEFEIERELGAGSFGVTYRAGLVGVASGKGVYRVSFRSRLPRSAVQYLAGPSLTGPSLPGGGGAPVPSFFVQLGVFLHHVGSLG